MIMTALQYSVVLGLTCLDLIVCAPTTINSATTPSSSTAIEDNSSQQTNPAENSEKFNYGKYNYPQGYIPQYPQNVYLHENGNPVKSTDDKLPPSAAQEVVRTFEIEGRNLGQQYGRRLRPYNIARFNYPNPSSANLNRNQFPYAYSNLYNSYNGYPNPNQNGQQGMNNMNQPPLYNPIYYQYPPYYYSQDPNQNNPYSTPINSFYGSNPFLNQNSNPNANQFAYLNPCAFQPMNNNRAMKDVDGNPIVCNLTSNNKPANMSSNGTTTTTTTTTTADPNANQNSNTMTNPNWIQNPFMSFPNSYPNGYPYAYPNGPALGLNPLVY